MTTEAQIAANRTNALKSTGPRTLEGKTRACVNSLSHGLTSARVLLPGEDPAEYHLFRGSMLAELAPDSPLELHFAENIVANAWRLRRVPEIEVRLLLSKDVSSLPPNFPPGVTAEIAPDAPAPDQDQSPVWPDFEPAAAWLDAGRSLRLANLTRHEAHVHRILCRDLKAYYQRRLLRETAAALRQAGIESHPEDEDDDDGI